MEKEYRVVWEIDIEAATPLDAAKIALQIQRDWKSMATVFDCIDEDGGRYMVNLSTDEVILLEEPDDNLHSTRS